MSLVNINIGKVLVWSMLFGIWPGSCMVELLHAIYLLNPTCRLIHLTRNLLGHFYAVGSSNIALLVLDLSLRGQSLLPLLQHFTIFLIGKRRAAVVMIRPLFLCNVWLFFNRKHIGQIEQLILRTFHFTV